MKAHGIMHAHGAVIVTIALLGLVIWPPAVQGSQQPAPSAATVRTGAIPSAPAAEPEIPPAPVIAPEAASGDPSDFGYPPEYIPLVQKTATALQSESFTFYPIKALDPFMPFIAPETNPALRLGDEEEEPRMDDRPLTPLQKMTMGEIERGLKAITWGDLGRRAVIEDSAGKGYIVAVGTPAGERNGVVMQIFNDHLVIQQEIWDRKAKKRIPQDFTVKLSKKTDKDAKP